MKKENRKLAQQKRAEQRKKEEQKVKVKKILSIAIPVAILVILVAVLIADAVYNKKTTDTSAAGSSTSSVVEAEQSSAVTESAQSTTSETDAADSSTTDNTDASKTDTAQNADTTGYNTDSSLSVEDGDTVNIDFVGTVDGVEFSGGNTQGQGTDLVIGSGSYIDDFEEQLIGAHPGDQVTVTVTFPENYGKDDLNGKEAEFAVTVNGIYK